MKIRVRTFGVISEIFPDAELEFVEGLQVKDFKTQIEKEIPELKNIHYTIALNRILVNNDALISANDEVALMPPFSGG